MTLNFGSGADATPENNILQSFSDATAGRSLQLYWGASMITSAGIGYALARDAGNSFPTNTTKTVGGNFVHDFDITINKTTLVGGLGYVDVNLTLAGGSGAGVLVGIYHWDGSTETLISTTADTTQAGDGGAMTKKLGVTVSKKSFKPGDILRLKCTLHNAGTGSAIFYYDPQVAGNELKAWIPVVNLE